MTFKITPHLAAAALAMGLGPVNAQTSGAVTNFSSEPVILAQASNTARTAQMAKDKFNRVSPLEVSNSIPGTNNRDYATALDAIDPRMRAAIDQVTGKINLQMRQAGQIGPYLILGNLPPGEISTGLFSGSKSFERDFMQYFHDLNGPSTGRTINIQRANVTSEEDFKMLQDKRMLSQNAMWTGGGKYMLNGFAADRNGSKVFVNPVDPYAYLEHAKFKTENGQPDGKVVRDPKTGLAIIENMDDPQLQNALIRCDPRYFGLPLDPSRQGNAPLAQPNGRFTVEPGALAPGQRPQPGQKPQSSGQKVEF